MLWGLRLTLAASVVGSQINPRSLVVGPFGGVYVRQHVSLKTLPCTHNRAALFKHILHPQQGCSIQTYPTPTTRLLYSNSSYVHNRAALFKLILLPQQGCSIQAHPTPTTGLRHYNIFRIYNQFNNNQWLKNNFIKRLISKS